MSKKEELFCYLRVSSKIQEDEGNSIDNQRFLGQKVSKKLGMTYVELNEGGSRKFIHDNDTVIMRGYCKKGPVRVGFGAVSSTLLKAK